MLEVASPAMIRSEHFWHTFLIDGKFYTLFSLLFGIGYGAHYISTEHHGRAASPGVVMAAALPVMLGAQLLMQALNFDVLNVPARPIHPYLRTV